MIKPALKWAGGKTAILNEIDKRISRINIKKCKFFDVFAGAGSVSIRFHDKFKSTIINDTNKELYNVYVAIKHEPKRLIDLLIDHETQHNHDYYYETRMMDRLDDYNSLDNVVKAARTIYLNKTCFNGLYRVNSKGYFNVPIGRQKRIKIYDKENILGLSKILKFFDIKNKDFSVVINECKPGDLVYIDPPYDKINANSFVEYNASRFDEFDQERLKNEIDELTRRGVYVIASNSYTDRIAELYKDYIKENDIILVRRSIASKSKSRKPIEEILIDNIDKVNNHANNS